jgi:hypothetical protein
LLFSQIWNEIKYLIESPLFVLFEMSENEELAALRQELQRQSQAVQDYELRMDERNRQRIQFISESKSQLKEGECEYLKEILNRATVELSVNVKNQQQISLVNDDIETLRSFRSKLNQDAFTLLGIDAPVL